MIAALGDNLWIRRTKFLQSSQTIPNTLCQYFATHLLKAVFGTVQELLGHEDVKTTMIYTHVLNRGLAAVSSPLNSYLELKKRPPNGRALHLFK